jgi:hypothetical protein
MRSFSSLPPSFSLVGPLFSFVVASACLLGCAGDVSRSARGASPSPTENVMATESAQSTNGRVGSHGMVVTGTPEGAFISHIPMFAAPHDVQAVVAGSFTTLTGSALPPSFSESLHTFVPDRMSLDALRLGSLAELRGQIFLGNFEQGGRPLPSRVRFAVSRVVHQHVLDAGATQPELTYLLFGSRERTFAVHHIAGAPSFDEVLKVDLDGDLPSSSELAAGLEVKVAGTPDDASARVGLANGLTTAHAGTRTIKLKSTAALSCLEGPDFSSPCP